jgi:hypothetical protein
MLLATYYLPRCLSNLNFLQDDIKKLQALRESHQTSKAAGLERSIEDQKVKARSLSALLVGAKMAVERHGHMAVVCFKAEAHSSKEAAMVHRLQLNLQVSNLFLLPLAPKVVVQYVTSKLLQLSHPAAKFLLHQQWWNE